MLLIKVDDNDPMSVEVVRCSGKVPVSAGDGRGLFGRNECWDGGLELGVLELQQLCVKEVVLVHREPAEVEANDSVEQQGSLRSGLSISMCTLL